MGTPVFSSPTLELRPKRIKMEQPIMKANRLVFGENYAVAVDLYSKILDEKYHPVAYLNRALCYTAEGQPHLAVNDALRAYMTAQAMIDVFRSQDIDGRARVNDHIRRIDSHLAAYTDDCKGAIARGEEWCSSLSIMFQKEHQRFKLTKMTLIEDEFTEQSTGRTRIITAVEDLKYKALFRLVDALARCGAGPAYSALHVLGDVLMASHSGPVKEALPSVIDRQLKALAKSIEDRLFDNLSKCKASKVDIQLTPSSYSLLNGAQYGFAECSINYATLNSCILTIDEDSIARYEYKFGVPTSLVATQDVFEGMLLFTESLPFAVSTANTRDKSQLALLCDTCAANLQIPSPFVLRVLIEELRQAEAEKASKSNARMSRRAARFKPSPANHRRTASVNASSFQTPPPSPKLGNKFGSDNARYEQTSSKGKEKMVEDDEDEDENEDSDDDSDGDWDSDSSSEASDTSSECSIPDTPLRGRPTSRPGIFETADIQVCRSGNEKQRENFSFCSVDCYDLAKSTYHDSVCGSYLEDYLRQTIIMIESSKLPSIEAQKLGLLLLSRILGWAYATSTDPLDLPVVQLLMASPRYGPLEKQGPVPWSFHNNVMRPYQMLQAMDGRGDAPKTVANPNYSDGRVINTIIGLIHRHMNMTDKILWTKTYDEEGYHEQTYPYAHKVDTSEEERILFGRLRPLCDLVPLAAVPEDANVELVDLGDGRIVCLPTLTIEDRDENSEPCIKKGTRLLLRAPAPRLATKAERTAYARKEDYGEGGTMMDAEQDEGILQEDNDEHQNGHQTEEPEEEFSGYVDEESYGAEDADMDDIDFDIDESDEDMMNF